MSFEKLLNYISTKNVGHATIVFGPPPNVWLWIGPQQIA